jgi:hypothetical protein
MSLETWLIYLAAGKLLTWLLQINGLMRPVWGSHPLLRELRECDLCLGFWVYLLLAVFLPRTRLSNLIGFPVWVWVIVLAALSSFIAHLLRIGWQTKFGVTVIE